MPEQKDPTVTIGADQLKDILTTVITEAKKPHVDVELQARKARDRERLRAERAANEEARKERESRCPHLREDGTSTIAWHTNSDNVMRGVCQRCNILLQPGHPDYMRMARVPTRGSGIVF